MTRISMLGLNALVGAAIGAGAVVRRVEENTPDSPTTIEMRPSKVTVKKEHLPVNHWNGSDQKPKDYYRKRNVPKKLRKVTK